MAFDPARVKSLFLEASDLPSPEGRAAFLDRECGGEPELRARVEELLAVEDRAGPIPDPEAVGTLNLTTAGSLEATRMLASETRSESMAPDLEAGLATVGATGVGSPGGTLVYVPPVAGPARFVPGQVIAGRYTLLEVLGEGGMGTVYKAEQSQPVRRMVALKLIRVGMDSRSVLARFDAERQALAMMDHPNIARVYDGGATDAGQPFFVMEFVQGVPITDYCDARRLPVAARLQLFVAVCQAVQHAHQKGIIHRDLKPSNVMVTEVDGRPTPKVIDFGVAKATESSLTDQSLGDTGAIVGTPTYMSPEQADPSSMDIDTRTDVYALGVILYELLAGSPPLDATQFRRGALLEMLRMVREVDPAKPSTKVSTADALPSIAANRGIGPDHLKRALRGDLDWIVMKALEKDRSRRYETANGLGADVLRHLASEPVQAAPPSRSYRLRKFARKHRAGVVAASLVVLSLVAGVAGTTWGLLEARRQEGLAIEKAEGERLAKLDAQEKEALAEASERKARAAAEEERKAKETVQDVLGFVEDRVFAAARPKGQRGGLGYDVTLADAIAAALPAIEQSFPGKPLVEARLRRTIGQSFQYLGKPEIAAAQFAAARSLYVNLLGPDHPDTLASVNGLAYSLNKLGRYAEALKLQEETLALQKASLGPDHPDTLLSMNNLANSYDDLGRDAEALKLGEETLARRKAKLGPDHPDTLISMSNLPFSYIAFGRFAEALKLREETLAIRKAKLGPDHPDTLISMSTLAFNYYILGRNAEALKLQEEALALAKAKLGPDHYGTYYDMQDLASTYSALGRHAEALKLQEEAVGLMKAKFGLDHPDTLKGMVYLALKHNALGRQAEALKLVDQAQGLMRAKFGPDNPDTLGTMNILAYGYRNLGRRAEALKLQEEVLGLMRARFGPDNPSTLRKMQSLADSYTSLGRHAEALKLREEVLAIQKAKLGPDDPETLVHMRNLAHALLPVGRTAEALPLLDKYVAANPQDTMAALRIAALWAWFGREAEFAEARRRALAAARGSDDATVQERAAKLSSILPSPDRADLDTALALARRSLEPVDTTPNRFHKRLALGMAAYRAGDDSACDEALRGAEEAGKAPSFILVSNTAAFFRAMSLQRRGRVDEARKLATEAAATMTPLPGDEKNPLLGNDNYDELVCWLAFKEARALIGFDPPDPLVSMSNLAGKYSSMGRHAEALKLREEVLALRKANPGPDHPDTIRSMSELAATYQRLDRDAEAVKLGEEALARRRAKLGSDHADTLDNMSNLARGYARLGRHDEAVKLGEEALARRQVKPGPDHPDTLSSMFDLANALLSAGRTAEALPLLDTYAAANPQDLRFSLKIAALWAWFGREAEFVATRRRVLAAARGSGDVVQAERAAKLSSIRPAPDRADLDAALALGRLAAKPGDEAPYRPYRLLALGMAAYRGDDDGACDEALRAAGEVGKDLPLVAGTSAFYRAMSLHRRGRVDEARKLATEAAATMKPLPADARNPLAGGANHDDLILWLAYKEAKALIGFDPPPAPTASPAK